MLINVRWLCIDTYYTVIIIIGCMQNANWQTVSSLLRRHLFRSLCMQNHLLCQLSLGWTEWGSRPHYPTSFIHIHLLYVIGILSLPRQHAEFKREKTTHFSFIQSLFMEYCYVFLLLRSYTHTYMSWTNINSFHMIVHWTKKRLSTCQKERERDEKKRITHDFFFNCKRIA